ncbi:PE-PPE domain-containing protein [Streptomyces sp. NPDC048483]|uniref:cutinase family protein n=1 Tax=Streptomyces sp. NPDC048483 TaxID=3154927 RepID=UPI003412DB8F
MSRLTRAVGTAVMTAAMVAGPAVVAPAVAQADDVHHYYLEVGGTGAAADEADGCTTSYGFANQHLDEGDQVVPVCYPASAGPWAGSKQFSPDINAPSYDASVEVGYKNLLAAAEETHRRDPNARLTIVGYSQGAQVADVVLQKIANNETGVPRSQVNGMLYADPMQPGTGAAARVPKGVSAFGFTSPGAGPEEFPGVPVERFCIRGDGVCDATSLESILGYFTKHGNYPKDGNAMTRTIANDGGNGITWLDA